MLDGCGREVLAPTRPRRIVCLCPSLTETIVVMGAGERLVGRSRYCIHPEDALLEVDVVGGTKNPDIEAIAALQPDLIIAEKEENRAEDIAALEAVAPVYVFVVEDLEDAFAMLERMAVLLDEQRRGRALAADVALRWRALPRLSAPLSCLYMIWRRPWMAAGRATFIHAVLARLGFENAALKCTGRYPSLEPEHIRELNPKLVLLSSEPYPFQARHE